MIKIINIVYINGKDEFILRYHIKGELHRDNGPSYINNERKEWYSEGILHKIGGPAIEWNDGDSSWHKHGKYHREDGPAMCYYTTNYISFVLDGIHYEFSEFLKKTPYPSEELIIEYGHLL